MPKKKFVTVTLVLNQGRTVWGDPTDYPVLIDGFPRDEDSDRVAKREGWI